MQRLVQEAYDHTGSGDVRAYLFPHGIRKLRGRDVNPALSDKSPLSSGSGAPDTQEEQLKQPQSE